MISGSTSTLSALHAPPLDSSGPFAPRNRPAKAPFSFADTPRLTAALRAGDERAFLWLHEQWNGRLFRYCFVLARGDGNLAQEIAQATYIRAFRHIRGLPSETALWNWLARAARNAASDLRRTGGRYREVIRRFAERFGWHGLSEGGGDGDQDQSNVLLDALDRVLAKLEKEELALVEARYFETASLEEIGIRFHISARAVEGRLARIRKKMRRLIAAELQKLRE